MNLITSKKYIRDGSGFYYSLQELQNVQTLCEIAKRLDKRHALPATSGNLSVRTSPNQFLITRSGYHKKYSNPVHFLRINIEDALPAAHIAPKPSDETKLHATIYSLFPDVNSIVHCHPQNLNSLKSPEHTFEGHELLKALGYKSHDEAFSLPVFKNSQDMDKLAIEIKKYFSQSKNKIVCAFHLEEHGIYCFGKTPEDAMNKLEVFLAK